MKKKNKLLILTASIALALLAAGCAAETPPANRAATNVNTANVNTNVNANTTVPPATAGDAATVSVADVTSNFTNYDGRTVTIVAEVEEVKGPRAFTLDEDAVLRPAGDLLVLSPQAGSLAAIDDQWLNDKVRVTGVVRRFVVTEVEREIGWDLDREIELESEGKPVLIARSVERVN